MQDGDSKCLPFHATQNPTGAKTKTKQKETRRAGIFNVLYRETLVFERFSTSRLPFKALSPPHQKALLSWPKLTIASFGATFFLKITPRRCASGSRLFQRLGDGFPSLLNRLRHWTRLLFLPCLSVTVKPAPRTHTPTKNDPPSSTFFLYRNLAT